MNDLGTFVIPGETLLNLLKRAQSGEDAELLLLELFSNSERQETEDE